MSHEPPTDELESLLERLCLGELDPSGWRRVGDLVRGDRDAARRYVMTAHDCEALRDETVGGEPCPNAAGLSAIETAPLERVEGTGDHVSLRSFGPLAWLAPWAIAVSLAFLCGWLTSGWRGDAPAVASSAAPVQPFVLTEDAGRAEPLGRVTGLTPVASSDGLTRSLKVGSQLGRGEVFQITRGAARLELAGSEVLVQGPAEISAIDTSTLFVRSGRVTVSHGGKMTVQTPVAIASAMGARFSVAADADAGAEVTTVEGVVQVDSAPRHGRGREPLAKVKPGQTLQLTDNGSGPLQLARGESPSEGGLVDWDAAVGDLHPYEKAVLADKPLAYWPLYRVRRHRAVLDLTQNGFDGYAIGNWPTELSDVQASQPRGAYFDGESYIESDRKPPVNLRTGFTIESWARLAGGPGYQSVFTSRWVRESNTPREQCFGFTLYAGENDRWQFWTGSGEYGRNWDQLHSESAVQRNRWTHVAATFTPDPGQEAAAATVVGAVQLYIDGVFAGEARHSVSLEDFAWPARIGAAEFVPRSLTSWLFKGELRDVALYDYVLRAAQVRAHAEQGKTAT